MPTSHKPNIQINPAHLDSQSLDYTAKKIYKKLTIFYPNSQLIIHFSKQGSHSVECNLQLTGTQFISSHKAPSFQQALHYCGRRLLNQVKKQNSKYTNYREAA